MGHLVQAALTASSSSVRVRTSSSSLKLLQRQPAGAQPRRQQAGEQGGDADQQQLSRSLGADQGPAPWKGTAQSR